MSDKVKLIYVLGASFSGSSLLGFMLGAPNTMWNLGELKYFSRNAPSEGTHCTCSKAIELCPFWAPLIERNDLHSFDRGTLFYRLKVSLFIWLRIPLKVSPNAKESQFLKACLEKAKELDENSEVLIDTSKSLWRATKILHDPKVELNILYIKRGAKENIHSFMKHGFGFWNGFFNYFIFHYLSKKWLRTNVEKGRWIAINHEELSHEPQKAIRQIEEFVGHSFEGFKHKMSQREYHVRSGNLNTVKQFSEGFQGFYYDNSWNKGLQSWQKKLIDKTARLV